MVSLSVSPLDVEVAAGSEKPMIRPPRRFTGRLEAEAGAGGRLEKEGGYDFAVKNLAVGVCLEAGGGLQQVKNLLLGKVVDGDDVAHKCRVELMCVRRDSSTCFFRMQNY